jgi:hypothetical protein
MHSCGPSKVQNGISVGAVVVELVAEDKQQSSTITRRVGDD